MNCQTKLLFETSRPPAGTIPTGDSDAANLVENCIGDVAGLTVLVVAEDPKHGWYDAAAPQVVCDELAARVSPR